MPKEYSFDWQPEVDDAWRHENTREIAQILEAAHEQTIFQWAEINWLFNRALSQFDIARMALKRQIRDAKEGLEGFTIDPQLLQNEEGKKAHLEVWDALPASLAPERIIARYGGFLRAGGRVAFNAGSGETSLLAAILLLTTLAIAQRIYTSRILRRLREVEGQILLNESALKHDCAMFRTIIKTRLLPRIQAMEQVAEEIRDADFGLTIHYTDPVEIVNVHKTRLAIALLEGKRLTSHKGVI
jgi:hypothetical protein